MATDVASTPPMIVAKLHRMAEPDILKPLVERARRTSESRGHTTSAGGNATLLSLDEGGI